MQYVVVEIADEIDALQEHLDLISASKWTLINVIWRETDHVYIVIHARQ